MPASGSLFGAECEEAMSARRTERCEKWKLGTRREQRQKRKEKAAKVRCERLAGRGCKEKIYAKCMQRPPLCPLD